MSQNPETSQPEPGHGHYELPLIRDRVSMFYEGLRRTVFSELIKRSDNAAEARVLRELVGGLAEDAFEARQYSGETVDKGLYVSKPAVIGKATYTFMQGPNLAARQDTGGHDTFVVVEKPGLTQLFTTDGETLDLFILEQTRKGGDAGRYWAHIADQRVGELAQEALEPCIGNTDFVKQVTE